MNPLTQCQDFYEFQKIFPTVNLDEANLFRPIELLEKWGKQSSPEYDQLKKKHFSLLSPLLRLLTKSTITDSIVENLDMNSLIRFARTSYFINTIIQKYIQPEFNRRFIPLERLKRSPSTTLDIVRKHSITHLNLDGLNDYSHAALQELSGQITRLSISNFKNLDLCYFTHLEELTLSGGTFTFPNQNQPIPLKTLNMYSITIPNSFITDYLKQAKQIKKINFPSCKELTKTDLSHFKNLEKLKLGKYFSFKEIVVTQPTCLSKVQLYLNTVGYEQTIKLLGHSPKLKDITLLGGFDIKRLPDFTKYPSLKNLNLSGFTQLTTLSIPDHLEELHIIDCSDLPVNTIIKPLTKLRRFSLIFHSTSLALDLSRTTNLGELVLWDCKKLTSIAPSPADLIDLNLAFCEELDLDSIKALGEKVIKALRISVTFDRKIPLDTWPPKEKFKYCNNYLVKI